VRSRPPLPDAGPGRAAGPALARKRIRVASVAVVLLGLCHYGWFWVFGPPSWWGSGVVVKTPSFAHRAPPALEGYLRTADTRAVASEAQAAGSKQSGNLVGTPFGHDDAPECGVSVVQTHAGRFWGDGQHLYVRGSRKGDWSEPLPSRSMTFSDATIVCPESRASILLTRWNPWWPFGSSYGRFLRSVVMKDLRSEYSVYALDVERRDLKYLFPGHDLVVSPDRRRVAYATSLNGFSGFHNVMVYDVRDGRSTRVLSLREVDPGSGSSFGYRFSADSAALVITGTSSGFMPFSATFTPLRIVYLNDTGELFDLRAGGTDTRIKPAAGGGPPAD
jgi:hypothetical protein